MQRDSPWPEIALPVLLKSQPEEEEIKTVIDEVLFAIEKTTSNRSHIDREGVAKYSEILHTCVFRMAVIIFGSLKMMQRAKWMLKAAQCIVDVIP